MNLFSFSVIIILYNCFSIQKKIKNGIYNILFEKIYLSYNKNKLSLEEQFKYPNTFFRIKRNGKLDEKQTYLIEQINSRFKLNYLENSSLIFENRINDSNLWIIIQINSENIIIKNINNCFLKIEDYNVNCDFIPFEQASQFKLIRIYSENIEKNNIIDYELLEKEPIDILIKYIDLHDPKLKRKGIHQIDKDNDNEELKYCVRSIIYNIPWIRKIFILMPNEKVRYFKEYKLINDRIIYVKDKDLLGYDSSNSYAFQFRYWKMKKFGISDNIIVMDDDYFIGGKLKKKEFFYAQNGKVLPFITTSNFIKLDQLSIINNYNIYKQKAENSQEEQTNDIFNYCKYSTFSFIWDLFNKTSNDSLFLPKFSHNAIPLNLNDIKEVYDLIITTKYKYPTLDSLYRHTDSLQFQIFMIAYTFLKYNRRVNNIPYKYTTINNSIITNLKYPLFCLNKIVGNYSYLNYYKSKIALEYLFYKPSPFEKVDYSIRKIAFNVVYSMEKEIKIYEQNEKNMISKDEFYHILIIILILNALIIIRFYLFISDEVH